MQTGHKKNRTQKKKILNPKCWVNFIYVGNLKKKNFCYCDSTFPTSYSMDLEFIILNLRRDPNLARILILRNIFNEFPIDDPPPQPVPVFNLQNMSAVEVLREFRFEKEDMGRLLRALRIPNEVRTRQGYFCEGMEALCIALKRLAYPNRLYELQKMFNRSIMALSAISNFVFNFLAEEFAYLLEDLQLIPWLDRERMEYYAQGIRNKGAAVGNCWGFLDGTARPICRPSSNDHQLYYSGHKRQYCVKYQTVMCPDGIIVSSMGAFPGARHDAGILRETNFYEQLEEKCVFPDGTKYVLFADQGYGLRELILTPFPGNGQNAAQANFNASMSVVRTAVEWGFGKILQYFSFPDFKKNQKLQLQDIEAIYKAAIIFTNCHTCLYHSGVTTSFFELQLPVLEEYLG